MSENKTYNSNLGEVLYGSVVGVGRIVGDFLKGALTLPVCSFMVPTTARLIKNQFKEAEEQGKDNPISREDFKNYWTKTPIRGIGALTTGILIGQYANEAYNFVSVHPYTLAIPVVTNLLSAGYERYRSDKLKGLEEKLE
jgi:hypothetical protein